MEGNYFLARVLGTENPVFPCALQGEVLDRAV